MRPSEGEETMALHIRAHRLPAPEREYRFAEGRRWRFDFAWPEQKLAVEVEGGTWSAGRHTRGAGFMEDCEKYARAAILGYRVIRVTTEQVRSGAAVAWIKEAGVIQLACSRCDRPLTRPVYVNGEAYGSTCAAIVAGSKQRTTPKRTRRAAAVASPAADPDQFDLFAEDLNYAQRVDALLSSISLEVSHA